MRQDIKEVEDVSLYVYMLYIYIKIEMWHEGFGIRNARGVSVCRIVLLNFVLA